MPETLQLERLVDDPEIRKAAAKSLKGFCLTYLPHHFPLDPSDFFDEMCRALEDHVLKRVEMIGFRGCAKSTLASLALPLWAALEHPELYPFIILLADTRGQASINAASVQYELRNNDLILRDYGHLKYKKIDDPRPEPTLESDEDWQAMNCVLDNGVRILSRSRGQKIRGLKHRQHRPKLVIGDDVEGLDWVRTQENRDKSDRWFRGDVLPSIDEDGRAVLIGNWLHTDGLMARLKNTGIFTVLEFPLVTRGRRHRSRTLHLESQISRRRRRSTASATSWGTSASGVRCFCRSCRRRGRTFYRKTYHYYDDPPFDDGNYLAHGVDLAISTKESADYTAIVSGEVTWNGQQIEIFIQAHPVIRRMTFQRHDGGVGQREEVQPHEQFVLR